MKRTIKLIIWCAIFISCANLIIAQAPPPQGSSDNIGAQPQAGMPTAPAGPEREPVVLAGQNIFFLDAEKDEPAALIKDYEQFTDRTALSDTNLAWLYLLYENNAPKAKQYFDEAVTKDPNCVDAIDGLATVYDWLGDEPMATKEVIEEMKINPDAPELDLLLSNLDFDGLSYLSPRQIYELVKNLLSKPLQNKYNETLLKEWLRYYDVELFGNESGAFKTWLTLGEPDKCLAIGYFSPHNSNCLDDAFPPEKEINLAAKYTIEDWDVKWHTFTATISNYQRLESELTAPMENRGSCIYELIWINSPAEKPFALQMNSSESYKIWLNNAVIARSDRLQNYEPNFHAVGGMLQKGSNKLLIKFLGRPAAIRITDPDGAPFTDLTYEITPTAPAPAAYTGEPINVKQGNYDYFAQRLKDPAKRNVNDYFYQSVIYGREGLRQESFDLTQEFYNAHKKSAMANYFMGSAYQNNEYLPSEKRQNLALQCFKSAEKLAPDYVPVKFALAKYYSEKNKDKAIEYYKQIIDNNPNFVQAYQKLSQVFKERSMPAESFDVMRKLEKLLPDNPDVAYLMGEFYYRQMNYDKTLAYYKKYYDLSGVKEHYLEMYLQEQLGNSQPMIDYYTKRIQVQPDSSYLYSGLLRIYQQQRQYEKVEQLYQKLLSLSQNDSEKYRDYRELAQLYSEWGKFDKAVEYWELLNKLPSKYDCYSDGIRRYLDFKRNKPESWPDELAVSVPELVKNAPSEKEYPQAGSIILFEEHLVKIMGEDESNLRTKETRTHEVVKLLNKKAGERYGDLYKYGELQIARVYTKDGRVLEPDPIQESWGSLRMPELDNGSVIELKYVKREPYSHREPGEVVEIEDSAFFRRNKEPLLWFHYVVNIPKNIKYKMPARYFDYQPTKKDTGDATTYIWEVKNLQDYDHEVMMPDSKEVLPWVDIYSGSFSFDKKIQEYHSRYLKDKIPYNVRDKAKELVKDSPSSLDKIKALYKYAVIEIKGGYGRGGGPGSDESLSQTIIEKEGSTSALMMGFLHALEIEAYWALPQERFTPGSNPDKEGPAIAEHQSLIYIPAEVISDTTGVGLFLQPAQFQPFGAIAPDIQGGNAYVIMPEGIKVIEIPTAPFVQNCPSSLTLQIKLAPDGSAEINGSVNLGGEIGTQIRAYLKEYATDQMRKQIVERITGELFPGSKLNTFDFSPFTLEDKITQIIFNCDVPDFGTQTDTGFEIKTVIKPLELSRLFLRETERKFPLRISIRYGERLNTYDRLTIILPANTSADIPDSALLATQYGYYSRWIKRDGQTITIERKFDMVEQDVPVQYYPAFTDFCKSVEQSEMEKITVRTK